MENTSPIDLTEGGKYWGIVRWSNEDVAQLLKNLGYKPTEESVNMVVKLASRDIADEMLDRALTWLVYVIGQCKEDLEEDD